MTATNTTPALCDACQARRADAEAHADRHIGRPTSPLVKSRDHILTITTWTACVSCTGGAR